MKSNSMKTIILLASSGVLILGAFLLPQTTVGQERKTEASTTPPAIKSSAYKISWSSMNGGGILEAGQTTYRLSASHGQAVIGKSDNPNKQLLAGFWNPSDIQTDVHPDQQSFHPVDFELRQNYPNPFNPTTTICYTLPCLSQVTLVICNLQGQQVRKLVDEVQTAGAKAISWDGLDERNNRAGSGIYLYRILIASQQDANETESKVFSQSHKMLLLK